MEQIFIWVEHGVHASAQAALGVSFLWGILSVLLSPCHLSSIPLIVGFISGQGKMTTLRAFGISSLFASGILVTIGVIGLITARMGRMWGDLGSWGVYVVAGILLIVGLVLLEVIPLPFSGASASGFKRRGPLAAFLLGLVFGIALGPCTFGYMAPVLIASFAVAKTNLTFSILLLAAYGIGHCLVIALAGASAEAVQRYLNWNERSKGAVILRRVCGALVLAAGVYLIYTAP